MFNFIFVFLLLILSWSKFRESQQISLLWISEFKGINFYSPWNELGEKLINSLKIRLRLEVKDCIDPLRFKN